MLNDETKSEILRNIALSGTTETRVKPIIGSRSNHINHILSLSSGSPRIQSSVLPKFRLILSQPESVGFLNPFEIRCALCNAVISYPCWYYCARYAVNHFHYFVCFDSSSPNKPSVACYKRIV